MVQKNIDNARYYISVSLREFAKEDQQKMQKFGSPLISIQPKEALYDGSWTSELPLYDFHVTFEFDSSNEADEYLVELKERIKQGLDYLRAQQDTFSEKEVSEF